MSTISEDPTGSGEYTLGTADSVSTTRWATPQNVDDVVGLTVDDAAISKAVRTLETITGLIEAVPRVDIADRDRYFLMLMTCYQVGFMDENPDLFSRADVTSASQDGESVNFRNVDSHLFAPLARKAYRRLSWRGLRAINAWAGPTARPVANVTSEAFDDSLPWSPV